MSKAPQSPISENLMRKVSAADHIQYGKSLVIASYYNITNDSYNVGIFSADGTLQKLVALDEVGISAPDAHKHSLVMHAVADILTANGQQLSIDPVTKEEILVELVKE